MYDWDLCYTIIAVFLAAMTIFPFIHLKGEMKRPSIDWQELNHGKEL